MQYFSRISLFLCLAAMLLCVLPARGAVPPVFAAQEEPEFEHISTAQGLSHNTVSGILRDSEGFMWFATVDGLNRYDGYTCRVYKHDPRAPHSLPHNFIECIYEDSRGRLWVGLREAGLCIMDRNAPPPGRFRQFRHTPENPRSLGHNFIQSVLEDSRGRLWVACYGGGLNLFNPADSTFTRFKRREGDSASLVSDFAITLLEDAAGLLWIGTNKGLSALDINSPEHDLRAGKARFRNYIHDPRKPNSLGGNSIVGTSAGRGGELYIATRGGGLSILDRERRHFHNLRAEAGNANSLNTDMVSTVYEDENGLLWIGGGGISLYERSGGRFRHFVQKPRQIGALSNNSISAFYVDSQGIYWIGTWGAGVNKYVPHLRKFRLQQHHPDNRNSLSNNFVYALGADTGGNVWVGTVGGGLNKWNTAENTWTRFVQHPGNPRGLASNAIRALHSDTEGNLWICTEFAGLDMLPAAAQAVEGTARFRHFPHLPGNPHSPGSMHVLCIAADPQERLWLGTSGAGLDCFEPRNGRWRHFPFAAGSDAGPVDSTVQALHCDAEGMLWIGTMNGLSVLDTRQPPARMRFRNYPAGSGPERPVNGDIRALLRDAAGTVWLGSYGGGLLGFDPQRERFRVVDENSGLPNNFIYALLQEAGGALWISSNRGLTRYHPAERSFRSYTTLDGLQADEFNTRAACRDSAGNMYFGGVNGLNIFHPAELAGTRNRYKAPVRLTACNIMGRPATLDTAIDRKKLLLLAAHETSFSFEFAALDFLKPGENSYAYMLENFDTDWIHSATRRFAAYTNIPAGDYIFRVKAANNDGVWNESGAALAIRIRQPLYQSWWFRAPALALLAGLLWAGLKGRNIYRDYRARHYIGRFKILRTLGTGGMATVYLARDRQAGRAVALKVFRPALEHTGDALKRFVQEAEIGRSLNHPSIVKIFDAGSAAELRYIAMEYIDGPTLKQYMDQSTAPPQAQTLRMALQLAHGLAAIHAAGIVHRDLKAENVMLNGGQPVIMDFGLARAPLLTTVHEAGQRMGTLCFMSPEQTLGKNVDFRSDIFSFGVLLYQMLFRALPFGGENEMELIFAIHNDTPARLRNADTSGLRPALHALLLRALAKDPAERFQTAGELIRALEACHADAQAADAQEHKNKPDTQE